MEHSLTTQFQDSYKAENHYFGQDCEFRTIRKEGALLSPWSPCFLMHELVTEGFIAVDYVSFLQANNSEGNIQ